MLCAWTARGKMAYFTLLGGWLTVLSLLPCLRSLRLLGWLIAITAVLLGVEAGRQAAWTGMKVVSAVAASSQAPNSRVVCSANQHQKSRHLLMCIHGIDVCPSAGWTADTKSQCGGSQNCPCGTANCDAQWPAVSCKEWDVCNRQSATWWQCDNRKDREQPVCCVFWDPGPTCCP